MKRLFTLALLAIISVGGAFTPAAASIIAYDVSLLGTESVPTNASTAFGSATVTVDDVFDTVAVALAFTGLTGGNASSAHIHCCVATNSNAPVVIAFTGFPAASSGTYTNIWQVSAATIAGIGAGLAYINIHNSVFPGGEIRGDILHAVSVPEPSTIALFGLGLIGLAFSRRRGVAMHR